MKFLVLVEFNKGGILLGTKKIENYDKMVRKKLM
jgi:hypothetical protein